MANTSLGRVALVPDFIERVKSMEQKKLSADLTVSDENRQGVIQIRNGVIVSSHTGILHGNGALLTLSLISRPRISSTPASDPVQKNVFISVSQLERFLASQKKPLSSSFYDEEKILREALTLFFRFNYKAAVEKLVYILRSNRFYYPAWLWQSRILTRTDYISKALDEAYRWGNHDQDIWREARKIRPQITENAIQIKRCFFCWSILKENSFCHHCRTHLTITSKPLSSDIKHDDVQLALDHFSSAFESDKTNARIAFTLALGYFNLGQSQRALIYLRLATKLSPQTSLYEKSLTLLQNLTKAYKKTIPQQSQSVQPTKLPATVRRPQASVNKEELTKYPAVSTNSASILVIEDSMTSRKVLSIIFARLGYTLIEAASGASAKEIILDQRPDLILLDVMLPDTNGHDLLVELRGIANLKDIPVIMLTGKHDAKDRMKGLQGGVNEYITKPFNPKKLTDLVQGYLSPKDNIAQKAITPPPQSLSTPKSNVDQSITYPYNNRSTSTEIPAKPEGKKAIFVIEDSNTSMKVLSMILGKHGYHTYQASSGEQALSIAPHIQPDLIVLDVMLPDTTGYTVLPKLKLIPHFTDLPVIMLTGKREAKDRMQGMLAGSNEYLTKPFDPQKLLSLINGYI